MPRGRVLRVLCARAARWSVYGEKGVLKRTHLVLGQGGLLEQLPKTIMRFAHPKGNHLADTRLNGSPKLVLLLDGFEGAQTEFQPKREPKRDCFTPHYLST